MEADSEGLGVAELEVSEGAVRVVEGEPGGLAGGGGREGAEDGEGVGGQEGGAEGFGAAGLAGVDEGALEIGDGGEAGGGQKDAGFGRRRGRGQLLASAARRTAPRTADGTHSCGTSAPPS